MILGSKEGLSCSYNPAGKAPPQPYSGTLTKYGLDLGVSGESIMIWTILGSSSELPDGALAGNYAGVSADAAVGLGVGANALVGGSNNSIVLQPLSVEGQTGLEHRCRRGGTLAQTALGRAAGMRWIGVCLPSGSGCCAIRVGAGSKAAQRMQIRRMTWRKARSATLGPVGSYVSGRSKADRISARRPIGYSTVRLGSTASRFRSRQRSFFRTGRRQQVDGPSSHGRIQPRE